MNFIQTDTDNVVLGSGELYAEVYDPAVDYESIKTEDMTCIGYIKESAELKSSYERSEIESANRGTVATLTKKTNVEFSTGIMSWHLGNVAKFLTGSKYVENGGKKTYYFGDDDSTPQVVLRFVSDDESNGKRITVNMFRCMWQGELDFNFNKDDPITFDYNFKVLSNKMPNGKRGKFSIDEETVEAESDAAETEETNPDTPAGEG